MRTNSHALGAAFIETQAKVLKHLSEKFATGRKVEGDSIGDAIIWAKDPEDAKKLVRAFKVDPSMKMDFLSDVTAYDNKDGVDGEGRFVLVYQLFSTELHTRVRIKTLLGEHQPAETITDIFEGANWLEREVYDMYGITFNNHPNMRRILMDERFSGHPLRKEYPMKQRQGFNNNTPLNLGASPLQVNTHTTASEEK